MLGYFSKSQAISCSDHSEQSLLPEHKEGLLRKSRFGWGFEMKTSFRNNLRRTSRNGKNYPMWAWHSQHSTMFICSQLILVTCSLWFERPASLEPFFLVIGRPTLWPDEWLPDPLPQPLGGGIGFGGLQFLQRKNTVSVWAWGYGFSDTCVMVVLTDFRDWWDVLLINTTLDPHLMSGRGWKWSCSVMSDS